jgi:hypothetical protein
VSARTYDGRAVQIEPDRRTYPGVSASAGGAAVVERHGGPGLGRREGVKGVPERPWSDDGPEFVDRDLRKVD